MNTSNTPPFRLIRLGTLIPTKTDATSLYRAVGPLTLLEKQIPGLVTAQMNEFDWSTLMGIDAMFVQRPFTENHHQIVKIVKRQRIPLWIDYDDFLFDVPKWNPVYSSYMNDSRQKCIAECIAMADVVSVTCNDLKEKILKLNPDVIVIPNAWNDHVTPFSARKTTERKKLVTWRGSNTHRNDLLTVRKEIVQLSNEHPEVTWNFIGEQPWFAEDMPEKSVVFTPAMDFLDYAEYMRKLEPSIHIVPLVDCDFNRCKSNIAWQEATMAGAVTIAPDFPEFRVPGVITYKSPEEFYLHMKGMMEGVFDLEKLYQSSLNHMIENCRLSNINEKRFDIIDALCRLSPEHARKIKLVKGGQQ